MRRAKRDGLRVVLDVEDNHLAGRDDRPDAMVVMSGGGPFSFMKAPSRFDIERLIGGQGGAPPCGGPASTLTWREYRQQQEFQIQLRERDIERLKRAPGGSPGAFQVRYQARQARWRGFKYRRSDVVWNYDSYRRRIMELDVGLCPLVETEWSRCRSDSKALEYAMAGALPVCSDAEPYRGWRWPLADDGSGFIDWLAWCVENRDTVRAHGQLWREAVMRDRTIGSTVAGWREALSSPEKSEGVPIGERVAAG